MRKLLAMLALLVTAPIVAQEDATRITDYALRQWALDFREYETEVISCMYGYNDLSLNGALVVAFGAHADIVPSQSLPDSARTHWTGSCLELDRFRLLGFAHNHPSGNCGFSGRDLATYEASSYELIVTVCSADRFIALRRGQKQVVCVYDAEAEPVDMRCREVEERGDQG